MKRVEAWLEQELRLTPDGPWLKSVVFRPDEPIEKAREWVERAKAQDTTDTEYRLVYVRVETTREVLD